MRRLLAHFDNTSDSMTETFNTNDSPNIADNERSVVIARQGIGGHARTVGNDSWITPKPIIEALGPFDLDPCQCDCQPWKCAAFSYTKREDGLSQDWTGRVWLNPPYSEVWQWMERLAAHGHGTALIFARTETAGFVREVWGKASAVLFLHGRLHFHHPDGTRAKGNSGGPSVLVAYGQRDAEKLQQSGLSGSLVSDWMPPR